MEKIALNAAELEIVANLESEVKLLPAPSAEELAPAVTEAVIATPAAVEAVKKPKEKRALTEAVIATPAAVEAVKKPKEKRALATILGTIGDVERMNMVAKINLEFDDRSTHENLADGGNTSIQDTLKKQRAKMAVPGVAALMIATNIEASVINRSIAEGKRFNVYAIDKLNDLLHGLNGSGGFKNAINIAVMKSLFKFRAAGVPFTGTAALAAASDKVTVDKQMKALLVRHTVSASTAPTQTSSTMTALSVIGAVINKGTVKAPIWELTDAPVTKVLEKVFADAKAA